MDFLYQKPLDVGDTLPVDLEFEIDDFNDDNCEYRFELWRRNDDQRNDKGSQLAGPLLQLQGKTLEGCYVAVRLGEECASIITEGEYTIKVTKFEGCNCIDCGEHHIKFSRQCIVNLARAKSAGDKCENECMTCE